LRLGEGAAVHKADVNHVAPVTAFGENASLLRLFDHRFDAFAGETHENLPPRAGVALGAGAVALLLLPWPICALWTGTTLGVELWGWFVGRRQYLGLPVTALERGAFLIYVAVLIACWFLLGAMFWLTGRMDGVVCATIVWVSIIGFAQTFGSRSPLAFAVCGVLPSIGVLSLMLAGPVGGHMVHNVMMERLPVAGIMALALGFAVAGARQTSAAGRRLEEMQGKLRDSDADYRLLADNISDVIGRLSLGGAWRYISPSIEATLGYTAAEFMALEVGEFIHPDDLQAVLELVGALTEGSAGRASLEYRQIAKDGRPVWIDTSFTVARDAATGEAVEIICLSRDIDARKALEHALVEAREKAEATAAAKTDFLANMSHELRSPLNAIIGFSGVLKGSSSLTHRDARHAALIADASDSLLVVVNDVLDFSKLESGAVELDPEPFDPLALARSVAALVEDQAAAKGLRLEVIADGEIGQVNGDGPRLRQVLLNLLSNALKFTTEGGVKLRLAQAPAAEGMTAMRIAVVDTGIGIPADKLGSVFERFNQADVSTSRRFGGTGLGLAICRRIVGLMGGTIGVESREGRGSIFWLEVELPLADAEAMVDAAAVSPAALDRPVRLLLVEDVDVNRELVRVILAPFEIEIDTATNGVEAIDAVRRTAYDLVLMDLQMPVMDGLTATTHIRTLPEPALQRLPIIAMTADVMPDQVQRCLQAGMNAHLGKPISPSALLQTIAEWTAPTAQATEAPAPEPEDVAESEPVTEVA
jgi:PAS domain S-box-containing protein